MTATIESKWEKVLVVNGVQQYRRQIGWYTLTEATDFQQLGEYGADYWTVTVQPGRYPIYALRDGGRAWHSLSIGLPGVIKSGSWWNKRQPGELCTAHLHPYQHSVAADVVNGTASHIELFPEVEARRVDFEYEGEQKHTHKIFCDGEQV